jgi:hypothetical protein
MPTANRTESHAAQPRPAPVSEDHAVSAMVAFGALLLAILLGAVLAMFAGLGHTPAGRTGTGSHEFKSAPG